MLKKNIINEILDLNHADGFLITSETNRYWLTGFESSLGYVVATKNIIYLFLDMRYYEKAKKIIDNPYIELVILRSKKQISDFLGEKKIKRLIVEKEHFLFDDFLFYKHNIHCFIPFDTNIMRIQKDEDELEKISIACKIASQTMNWIRQQNLIGLTEIQVANMVTSKMLELGATKNSFDPIVASGINGAYPHHKPTNKLIQNNEFVTIDMGCIYSGYCSDITRTFPIGNPDRKLVDAYNKVLEANIAGINGIKWKKTGSEVDAICRSIIDESVYKNYFVHSTGHGVGVEVHEYPNVSQSYTNPLEHNSVITIEPGIYIPGLGGIRIEDMVVVKENGENIVLTKEAIK